MIDKNKALEFVKQYLQNTYQGLSDEHKSNKYWRPDAKSRFEHTKRVHNYAKNLCYLIKDAASEVVEVAAIFHDVSKYIQGEERRKAGVDVAREYLTEAGADEDFINKVCQAITSNMIRHDLDDESKLSIEDMVLIDANMLDEKGLMTILWVAMKEGREDLSYERCLEVLNKKLEKISQLSRKAYTEPARQFLTKNYMILKGMINSLERELNGELF